MTKTHQPLIEIFPGLRKNLMVELGYKNLLAVPRLSKVVISVGIGKQKDPKWKDHVIDRITKIIGQRPIVRGAKKSIASFKVRTGDPSGVLATLRGRRMLEFLERFIHVALPRTRDFRGIQTKAIDAMGNVTIGVREHTIFPETADEELKNIFGFAVTICTTARDKKSAEALLRTIGVPFKR